MKITLSFSIGDLKEISDARRVLDLLDPKPAPIGTVSVPPPAPPPPPSLGAAAPAPPPPAPPPPQTAAAAPSSATASSAPAPSAPPPPPDVELDSAGRPWDERFHAKTKNKIKDGTWRRKRGVSQEDVEAALPKNVPDNPAGVVPPTPPLAPTPPPPTDNVVPIAGASVTWAHVVEAFQKRASKYTQEQVQAALRSAVIEPTNLFECPEQYAAAITALDAKCPM